MEQKITSITQIPGIFAGHSTDAAAGTGCTAIICPGGAVAGVDVRGGAPATRETDLLRPEETVQAIHAVVLSGGSAYGLSASCGVAEELERRGIGLDVGVGLVPIVSGACLFDLAIGDASVRPTSVDGIEAAMEALDNPGKPLERGNVGAGTGCSVGKIAGPMRSMKSGLGENVQVSGNLVCGAVTAVNAVGDVFDPVTHEAIAGVLDEQGNLAANTDDLLCSMGASMPLDRTNTTISCVVTNAKLTKAECTKIAQMCGDAYAHAIRPVHTTNDGDTVFVMSTGEVEAMVDAVGALAVRALERAIADGARSATGAYGIKAACDL
jgi:L-aminopeptidase/D-esterase-like protein